VRCSGAPASRCEPIGHTDLDRRPRASLLARDGLVGGVGILETAKPILADSPASMSELAQFPVGGKSGSIVQGN